jgi:hypothetical protein
MSTLLRLFVPVAALAVGAAVVAVPGGCKRPAAAGPATVRGAVAFQGKPLTSGLVIFSPDPDRGGSGKPARGELGPDGRFRLTLAGSETIPAGWYRVAILAVPTSGSTSLSDGPAFPAKLARPDMSGIVREVQPGRDNEFEFAVEVSSQ